MSKKTKKIHTTVKSWRFNRPYNELPPLPPLIELETKAVLKQCIAARAALAELKQAAELIPDQAMLIATLPLLEAKESSAIENIVTTADQLFQFREADPQADPATKEALRYRHALMEAFHALDDLPVCTRLAEQICSRIQDTPMHVRVGSGTALAKANGDVVYTPPEGEQMLRDLLANWERFLHDPSDLDPLIRMAVAHYQFEAIHPFRDGNGRTGRILNNLFLIEQNLLTLPILYLSRYILVHRADYYQLLHEVTSDGRWEAWLLYILQGVADTARWTIDKIASIRELALHTTEYVRKALPKIYSHELINLIFEKPYCRIHDLVESKIAERQTASRYLNELVKISVLEEKSVGREKLFTHPKLLRLLTRDGNTFTAYR